MPFDFKKEYRELYLPQAAPSLVAVPPANYVAVRGQGDPNEEGGAYGQAVSVLYAVAYTVKMSGKGGHRMEGYFDYVVPPLEGFWRQEGAAGADLSRKADFRWTSVIRLPDFVTREELAWAAEEAGRKKKLDCSRAAFLTVEEGLCVQCMHLGPFDGEGATVALMERWLRENGYENDFSDARLHHEIYLSDPRRVPPEKWKTVIRHPVRRAERGKTP